jgi:hypothetical protein
MGTSKITIISVADRARDSAAGLQLFLDDIRPRNRELEEAMNEFMLLNIGLLRLQKLITRNGPCGENLSADIVLLLSSMDLTLARIWRMFGDTKNTMLDGRVPYRMLWTNLCNEWAELLPLVSRLQLYSVFLNLLLSFLKRCALILLRLIALVLIRYVGKQFLKSPSENSASNSRCCLKFNVDLHQMCPYHLLHLLHRLRLAVSDPLLSPFVPIEMTTL